MIVPCADGVAQAGSWCIEHSVDHLFERKHERCQAGLLLMGITVNHRVLCYGLRCFFTRPDNLKPRIKRRFQRLLL